MRAMYAGKRPLEGPATFTHQRTHPTLKDALSILGPDGKPVLKMVTTDPVEAYMLKWREMKRFTAALRIVKESEEAVSRNGFHQNKRGPEGWVEYGTPEPFADAQRTGRNAVGIRAVVDAGESGAGSQQLPVSRAA